MVRAIDGLSRFFGAIAAVLVIVLVVLMLYDVVLRYVFNAPTIWGNDINTWLMGASFVLSIAYAMSTDSHVRVDLLYDERTRPRIRYFDLDRPRSHHPADRRLGHLGALGPLSWTPTARASDRARAAGTRSCGRSSSSCWSVSSIFTLQIFAEIIKRAASLAGRPIETLTACRKICPTMESSPAFRARIP